MSGRPAPHAPRERPTFLVGDVVEVDVEKVAHGGHCVARVDGVVAFVRHALPGERVVIRVTEVRSRFIRADAIQVITAHPGRRMPLCPSSGVCGGCDYQHASESVQRDLKLQVMREALIHHARLDPDHVADVLSEGVIDLGAHTGWRSRMRYRTIPGPDGRTRLAMLRHRSEDAVDATACVIADPTGHDAATRAVLELDPGSQVVMASGLDGPSVGLADAPGGSVRQELRVGSQSVEFHVPIDGFWQVHPRLAQAIVDHLVQVVAPRAGETWWDLYAGAGPLAAALAERVGPTGRVVAVEASKASVETGMRALDGMAWVQWHRAEVGRWLNDAASNEPAPDGIVLDPPRTGAGAQVLAAVVRPRPRSLVIVACDPIALARDTASLVQAGYRLRSVRIWDAFPQTHHMETLATFEAAHQIS